MKSKLMIGVVLAAALSTSAFAAPPKHRPAADRDAAMPYGQTVSPQYLLPRSEVVTFGDRVVGKDPDPNIRTQLEHDPVPSEY